jgi:ring-1,2-phenylacetyl-CoA epoxidase subunit PaaE
MAAPRFHKLAVADVRRETDDAVSLAFAVPARRERVYRFLPGQYLTLRATIAGEDIRRSYSICSGRDDGELRAVVKRVAGGVFSNFVHDRLKPGEDIEVMTPAGQFTLPAPVGARTIVAVACGSGITPVMSHLKTVLAREPASQFVLLYGNRTGRDIIFAEALAGLKDRYLGRFSLTHVLSREMQDLPVLHGRLDRERIGLLLRGVPTIDHALICGPAGMMDEAVAAFAVLEVPAERIHREYFTAGEGGSQRLPPPARRAAPQAEPVAIAEIVIDGRHHEVPLPGGVSVIDAAHAQGIELPFSCKGGMCCSCRARLVSGKAEMAVNYSLQPWEIAAGFILTCQARPLSPRLVLDYDAV